MKFDWEQENWINLIYSLVLHNPVQSLIEFENYFNGDQKMKIELILFLISFQVNFYWWNVNRTRKQTKKISFNYFLDLSILTKCFVKSIRFRSIFFNSFYSIVRLENSSTNDQNICATFLNRFFRCNVLLAELVRRTVQMNALTTKGKQEENRFCSKSFIENHLVLNGKNRCRTINEIDW